MLGPLRVNHYRLVLAVAKVQPMQPSTVCAALADRDRLRLFGEIARDPAGVPVSGLVLDPRGRKALGKLLGAGLVERHGDRFVARPETFREALGEQDSGVTTMAGASARVSALFSRGRLVSMPRPGALRTELLRYLLERFDQDRAYSEKEIGELLEPVYGDHASVRRYLVDEGLMDRDNLGTYWRVDVPVTATG
jgi:hypothetical protein